MKKSLFVNLLLVLFLINSCSQKPEWQGIFDYYPEKPEPGDEITIFYNSDSTKMSTYNEIDMIAYLYSTKLDDAIGVEMKKVKNGWEGKIKTEETTLGVIVKFKNDDNVDNNEKSGYIIHLYGDNGEILPGSYSGLGGAHLNWGSYYIDLERDFNLSIELMEKDFEKNPGVKEKFLSQYLLAVSQLYPNEVESVALTELNQLEQKSGFTEDDLKILVEWYGKINNEEKSTHYEKTLSEKFPESETIQVKRYQEVLNEHEIERKKELADEFYNDFPDSRYSQTVYDLVANYYRDNNQYDKALEFFRNKKDRTGIFRFYSVNQKIFKENADPNVALEIAKIGVERAEKELKNPSKKKPEYLTHKEWKQDIEFYAGINYFSYGKALYLTGNKKEAEINLQKAVELTRSYDGEINEMYVTAAFENDNKEKARKEIEQFIKEGKSTAGMSGILKEIYISENGSEDGFEDYLLQFKTLALEELKNKLSAEMINKPAPEFEIEDIDGNMISLTELKGKTVIIDFWATWCGPCLQSFPGMKKAVEKYSDNKDVKFLFINSWERVEDKKKNAKDFIKKNNYPFHVLMDYENEVITDFGVAGIPTKFIIDKNGDIRFMSVGFLGNTDYLVDEISVMIDLVN